MISPRNVVRLRAIERVLRLNFSARFQSDKASASDVSNVQRLAESLDYCVKIVEERDYENFVATLLMPKAAQPAIFSMLALNAEVAVVRQKIKRNSGVAGIYQLQFWRDALRVWAGQQKGILPRQPSVSCLKVFGEASEDVALMLKLVEARQATLGDRPFKTLADLEDNSTRIYGSVIRLWAAALVRTTESNSEMVNNPAFVDAGEKLAKSLGIAILLRATLPLLKEGVVLLPEDLMAAHNLTPDLIFNNKNPKALQGLAGDLCQVSVDYLNSARESKTKVDKNLRPALLASGFRAECLTKTLCASNYNLFEERLQQRHPFTSWKLWWRYRRTIY